MEPYGQVLTEEEMLDSLQEIIRKREDDVQEIIELTNSIPDFSTGTVNSVNGQTGVVVLDSDDIPEGSSNLYNQVPAGGTAGQVLNKIDGTDYNLQWSTFTVQWGDISGTLSAQTDLQAALDAKPDDLQDAYDNGSGEILTDAAKPFILEGGGGADTDISFQINNNVGSLKSVFLASGQFLTNAASPTAGQFAMSYDGVSSGGTLNWVDFKDGGVSQGSVLKAFGLFGFVGASTAFFAAGAAGNNFILLGSTVANHTSVGGHDFIGSVRIITDFRAQGNTVFLDADNDSSIKASTDDRIDLTVSSTNTKQFTTLQDISLGVGQRHNVTAVSGSSYSVLLTDYYLDVEPDVTGISIAMPRAVDAGEGATYEIADISGTASSRNISVRFAGSDTCRGASVDTINTDYGTRKYKSNGIDTWTVLIGD